MTGKPLMLTRRRAQGLLVQSLALAATGRAWADEPDESLMRSAVSLPGTRQVRFMGGKEGNSEYRLLISEPAGKRAPPATGLPVLLLLDGNASFGAFHDAKRSQEAFAEALVVGVGYPTDGPHDFLRRSYDFSPAVPKERNNPPQGGDDEFLDTLMRIVEALAQRYPVDRQRLALYGHSFGGMFALHALFTRPQLFRHYVIASPSIWWNDHYLLAQERAFTRRVEEGGWDPRHQSVMLAVAQGDSPQDVQELLALGQRLAPLSRWGLRSTVHVQPDENHMTLPVSIAPRVLRQVLTARSS